MRHGLVWLPDKPLQQHRSVDVGLDSSQAQHEMLLQLSEAISNSVTSWGKRYRDNIEAPWLVAALVFSV